MSWRDVLNPYSGQKTREQLKEEEAKKEKVKKSQPKRTEQDIKKENCDRRVAEARSFCKSVDKLPNVSECVVDDWSDYCDELHVIVHLDLVESEHDLRRTYWKPKKSTEWNLGSITKGINKIADEFPNTKIGNIDPPRMKYLPKTFAGNRKLGYDKPYIDIDLYEA